AGVLSAALPDGSRPRVAGAGLQRDRSGRGALARQALPFRLRRLGRRVQRAGAGGVVDVDPLLAQLPAFSVAGDDRGARCVARRPGPVARVVGAVAEAVLDG